METKSCSTCGEQKSLDQFGRNCKSKGGRLARCKACNRDIYRAKYETDPRYRAQAVWFALQQRLNNANGKNPSYATITTTFTKEEFIAWYAAALPAFFVRYGNDATPSVDRIKSKGHYSAGNVRLIPLQENSNLAERKHNLRAPKGKAWCTHCKRFLSRNMFHKNRSQAHGLQHSCKQHRRNRVRS